MFWGNDFGTFILSGLLLLFVCLALLFIFAFNVRRRTGAVFLMVGTFIVFGWALQKSAYSVHTWGQWIFEARKYKASVLAQPATNAGEFRHVEWDGWSGLGAGDTTVYLVFDPGDALSTAARTGVQASMAACPATFTVCGGSKISGTPYSSTRIQTGVTVNSPSHLDGPHSD